MVVWFRITIIIKRKIMKKILLSAMISTVLAGSTLASTPSPAFHGLYAGGGLTYSVGKIKVKARDISTAFTSKGLGFNGFLGYGGVFYNGIYLGAELGLGYDGSLFKEKLTSDPLPNGARLTWLAKPKSKLTFNIAGRIGYAFSKFLAYGKVGYERRSKINTLGTFGSFSRDGILLGIGGDYAMTERVFVRAEYTYNFGSRRKISILGINATFHTPTQTVLIGAGYKF